MERAVPELPDKDYYRLTEVCQYTDTQPYVLRFWESEFPQLSPSRSRSGQPMYRRGDIDLVLRIKQLLYDEEYTIAAARLKLEQEGTPGNGEPAERPRSAPPAASAPRPPEHAVAPAAAADPAPDTDSVPRSRYEDAIDEIEHLRFQLRESEKRRVKAEGALEKAELRLTRERERAERAIERLSRLLESLGAG
jgi:DNA-binding transcriptional MerR regulator